MSEDRSRLIMERGLNFFGIITASLSHEINNVFAIINELSGLLNDLLLAAENGHPIEEERLKKLSDNISSNVERGVSIIKRLNSFSHSIDEKVVRFDMNQALNEIITTSERLTSIKGFHIEAQLPREPVSLTGNPFAIQFATFLCIGLAMDSSNKEVPITVTLEKLQHGAKITVFLDSFKKTPSAEDKLSFLSILTEEFGGKAELAEGDNGKHSILLSFQNSVE